ncbi:MAG: hypothetical protein IPM25_14410 [Chloracidobacterium sp.]|nr:hypothetical protein [Chloracidobacterium sp.]
MPLIRTQEEADPLIESLAEITRKVIAPIVRRKLHASLDTVDTHPRNLDALELVGDVTVAVLTELSRDGAAENGRIRDLHSYAATVTSNACYQYLRAKFPIRTQQRNRLRYVLTHKKGYSMWKDAGGEMLCGLEKWQNSGTGPTRVEVAKNEIRSTAASDDMRAYLAAVESVLTRASGPVRFADLVEHLMRHFGISEHTELQCGPEPGRFDLEGLVADTKPPHDRALETTECIRELWKAIGLLSLDQRRTLLLNLRSGGAEGIINLLPLSGVASIGAIADALSIEREEFAAVWNSLPWDDLKIADYLGITRQQVINLRYSARTRLAKTIRLSM